MSQQQQKAETNNNKKQKNVTRKIVKADNHKGVEGGDAATSHSLVKEKKPLHTSMEQLRVQKQNAIQPPSKTAMNANRRRNSLEISPGAPCLPTPIKHPNQENNKPSLSKSARVRQKRKAAQRNKYLAIDCEMVGIGHNGEDDMLARVSIVNKQGNVLLDKFVKPRDTVTDYRTSVSGIRPNDIENGEDFNAVQDEVVELLQGKILVGHAINNDLAVLHIKHPYKNTRDTSRYKPLCRLVANGHTPSLKRLSQAILGLEIQTGEHNSVEDARAAMNIYNHLSGDWEQHIQKTQHRHRKT